MKRPRESCSSMARVAVRQKPQSLDPGFVAAFESWKHALCFVSVRSGLWRFIPAPRLQWDHLVAADGHLILFQRAANLFFVYNPSTGDSQELPPCPLAEPFMVGFKSDPVQFQVVVLSVVTRSNGFLFESEGFSWRTLDSNPIRYDDEMPLCYTSGPCNIDGCIRFRMGESLIETDTRDWSRCSDMSRRLSMHLNRTEKVLEKDAGKEGYMACTRFLGACTKVAMDDENNIYNWLSTRNPICPGRRWLRNFDDHATMRVQLQGDSSCVQLPLTRSNQSFGVEVSGLNKVMAIWPHCPIRKGMLSLYPLKLNTRRASIARFVPENFEVVTGPGFVAACKFGANRSLCFYSTERQLWTTIAAPEPGSWEEVVAAHGELILFRQATKSESVLKLFVFHPASRRSVELPVLRIIPDKFLIGFYTDHLMSFSVVCGSGFGSGAEVYVYTSGGAFSWRRTQALPADIEVYCCWKFAHAGACNLPAKFSWRLSTEHAEYMGLLTFDFAEETWSFAAAKAFKVFMEHELGYDRETWRWVDIVGAGKFEKLKVVMDSYSNIMVLDGDGSHILASLSTEIWEFEWQGIDNLKLPNKAFADDELSTTMLQEFRMRVQLQGSVVAIQVAGLECVAMKDTLDPTPSWMMWGRCPVLKGMQELHPLTISPRV